MGKQNRLRVIIAEKGLRQKWIAEQAGIKEATLSELVNQKREPTLATARKIAKVLGCEIREIWPEE